MMHDVDAERAVLGALLMGAEPDDVAEVLQGRDFYQPRHESIFDACLAVHRDGHRIDVPLVLARLGGELAKVGGPLYLAELVSVEATPHPGQARQYARQVADKALLRRLVEAARGIEARAAAGGDPQTVAADARMLVDQAAENATTEDHSVKASDQLWETLQAIEHDKDTGLSTGWPDLDDLVTGLLPGQLVVIGARPAVGKSVLGSNLAAHAAGMGVPVHMASLEMSRHEVMSRMLAAACTVNLTRVLNHRLTDDDWRRIGDRSGVIHDWPLRIDDRAGQSLQQVRAAARSTRRRMGGLGLLVVDYLQLMAPRDRRVPREQQVGELSEGLKVLARELECPVVALAQVNRNSTHSKDGKPTMSDLRESGRIEADADGIWLLHRADLVAEDGAPPTGELDVIVAKNRSGPQGHVKLAFQGHYSRAVSLAA